MKIKFVWNIGDNTPISRDVECDELLSYSI